MQDQEEEYIKFEEMPNMFGKMFSVEKSLDKETLASPHKTYSSLFEELCDKCYPERYMEPYDAKLVSVAIKLYSEVIQSEQNVDKQKDLRHRAYKELGVKFDGSQLYHFLMDYLDPHLYLNPFLPDRLEVANKYYPSIEANKDDYIALEHIESEVKWFVDEINEEREIKRQKEEEASMNEEQLALRRSEEDRQWLEEVRNSLGEENWRRYVEEEYGGYIHTDSIKSQEEEDAWRRYNADKALLEDIRNSLGEYHWKKFIKEEYGGYIKV